MFVCAPKRFYGVLFFSRGRKKVAGPEERLQQRSIFSPARRLIGKKQTSKSSPFEVEIASNWMAHSHSCQKIVPRDYLKC